MGRKRKSRSIASTGEEKAHTVKIKKVFLRGRDEVDEYSWEHGIWAPTKDANELHGLEPSYLLVMHEIFPLTSRLMEAFTPDYGPVER